MMSIVLSVGTFVINEITSGQTIFCSSLGWYFYYVLGIRHLSLTYGLSGGKV